MTTVLRIKGQYKGEVAVNLSEAIVGDLKQRIAQKFGLSVGTIKILAGGKKLVDDDKRLAEYGVNASTILMVLRQADQGSAAAREKELQAECGRVEAARKIIHAAPKIAQTFVKEAVQYGSDDEGPETRRRRTNSGHLPHRMELTTQDGEAAMLPAKDRAALTEGMLLHQRGRRCLQEAELARRAVQGGALLRGTGEGDHEEDVDGVEETKSSAGQVRQQPNGNHNPAQREPPPGSLRSAREEALVLFTAAEEAFQRADPTVLDTIDNYAHLCLDITWLLFLMQDLDNLPLATRLLKSAEQGFQKAHGPGLERLTFLKGQWCPEKVVYVRLHLLQAVVAFLSGEHGEASRKLLVAQTECETLKVDPKDVEMLMRESRTVWRDPIEPRKALRALRAGDGTLAGARQYLEADRQRRKRVQEGAHARSQARREERKRRRFGRTADNQGWVDPNKLESLESGGFEHEEALSALRSANNNVERALQLLTMQDRLDEDFADDGFGQEDMHMDDATPAGAPPAVPMAPPPSAPMPNAWAPGEGQGGGPVQPPPPPQEKLTEEERAFADDLARALDHDDEEYLDVTLQSEANAIKLYMMLCRGDVPLQFDLDKVRQQIQQ